MQLCLSTASTGRGNQCLPSRACTSSLTGNGYGDCGCLCSTCHCFTAGASSLSAQKTLYHNGPRATSDEGHCAVSGTAMFTLMVQECHLWLGLADMRDADKILNSLLSQTGLFCNVVESFAQQFLTMVIKMVPVSVACCLSLSIMSCMWLLICTLLPFNYVESLVYDRQTLLDIRSSDMDVFEVKIGNFADYTQGSILRNIETINTRVLEHH